jgi:hypothetical protein
MNRNKRVKSFERALLRRIAEGFAAALRDNLKNSTGAQEGADVPLVPLGIWDDANFRTKGVSGGWTKADRKNSDKPLVDTGKLLKSIKIESIDTLNPNSTSSGAPGSWHRITVKAAPHGLEQSKGGKFSEILLGRTKAIRASRNFGDMREGYDYVVRHEVTVPSRPWNFVGHQRLTNIARDAARRAAGV